jgi:hypothetical protein
VDDPHRFFSDALSLLFVFGMPPIDSCDVDPQTGDFHWVPFRAEATAHAAATCTEKTAWLQAWRNAILRHHTLRTNGLDEALIYADAHLAFALHTVAWSDASTEALIYDVLTGGALTHGHWATWHALHLPLFTQRLSLVHMQRVMLHCKAQCTPEVWQQGQAVKFHMVAWHALPDAKWRYASSMRALAPLMRTYCTAEHANVSAVLDRLPADPVRIVAQFASSVGAFAPARPMPTEQSMLQRLCNCAVRRVKEQQGAFEQQVRAVAALEACVQTAKQTLLSMQTAVEEAIADVVHLSARMTPAYEGEHVAKRARA